MGVDDQRGRAPAKYRQIAAALRARIESGEFPVGSQLPTKQALMDAYAAADGTVNGALRELREIGMVETRQGAGSFVVSAEPVAEPDEVSRLGEEIAAALDRLGKVEQRLTDLEQAQRSEPL